MFIYILIFLCALVFQYLYFAGFLFGLPRVYRRFVNAEYSCADIERMIADRQYDPYEKEMKNILGSKNIDERWDWPLIKFYQGDFAKDETLKCNYTKKFSTAFRRCGHAQIADTMDTANTCL